MRRSRRVCMSSTCISRPLRMIATRSATCSTSASTWPEKITRLSLRSCLLHQPQHDRPRRRVQSGGRLVQDQGIDRIGEDLGQRQLLLHACGVRSQLPPEVQLHDPFGDGHGTIKAGPIAKIAKQLERTQARQGSIHPQFARQIRNEPADVEAVPPAVKSSDPRPTGCRPQKPKQQSDRRRFSRAVGPQQPKNLATAHLQRQRIEAQALACKTSSNLGDKSVHYSPWSPLPLNVSAERLATSEDPTTPRVSPKHALLTRLK